MSVLSNSTFNLVRSTGKSLLLLSSSCQKANGIVLIKQASTASSNATRLWNGRLATDKPKNETACCTATRSFSKSAAHFQSRSASLNPEDSRTKAKVSGSSDDKSHASIDKGEKRNFALGRLNHVAIACADIDATSALFRDVLGATVTAPQDLPSHGVQVVFIELGNTKLELLKPLNEKSPISAFLQRNPAGGIHHICIEVDNVEAASDYLSKKNIKVLGKPSIGAHNKPVIFLHPKSMSGVLTELEQA